MLNPRAKRLAIAALAFGAPLLLLAVDTLVRLALGWRPPAGFDRRATILVGLSPVIWGGALAFPAVRRLITRRWAPTFLLGVMAMLAWATLELVVPGPAAFHLRPE